MPKQPVVEVAPCFREIMEANGWTSLPQFALAIGFHKEVVYDWNERLLAGEGIEYFEKHKRAAERCKVPLADWFSMFAVTSGRKHTLPGRSAN